MKRTILLFTVFLLSYSIANAQILIAALVVAAKNNERMDVGLKLGANYSNLFLSPANNGIDQTLDSKLTLNFGLTLEYALTKSKNVYAMSGVELSNKGVRINETPGIESPAFRYLQQSTLGKLGTSPQTAVFSMRYLQVPLHLGYKMSISKDRRFVVRGGGYVAYAFNGYLQNGDVKLNVFGKLAKENDIQINRFDAGLGGALGLEFGSIKTTLGYDWGLVDFDKTDSSAKNRVGYLALGYQF